MQVVEHSNTIHGALYRLHFINREVVSYTRHMCTSTYLGSTSFVIRAEMVSCGCG